VVVLISALACGVTPRRFAQIRDHVGVCRRTLQRWRAWWQATFAQGRFWREAKARLAPPPPQTEQLPASLLGRFSGDDPSRLLATLAFLLPITTMSSAVPAF
jgi:alkanesulfonate monooxygenase SsuD/methylene tetrahydromethanopterin reductase-like flavin-dependent oxidoreductase (luciferase family)